MYCHSKLVRLEPKRNVLLIGDVSFVQGHFNNYFAEPIPIAPGTLVKLYGRTFDIRISSNQHCIFIRTEDIIKNRIRMQPIDMANQQEDGDEEVGEDSAEQTDDDQVESYEPDSAYEDDETTDGSRTGPRLRRRQGRSGAAADGTPQVMPPGAARRARMANAATQTTPPAGANRNSQRRHSI